MDTSLWGEILEFSDNVRVYSDWSGVEVSSITVDGSELEDSRMYEMITSTFAATKLLKLPQERIVRVIGDMMQLLVGTFVSNDPIKEDMLGGDKYVREGSRSSPCMAVLALLCPNGRIATLIVATVCVSR